MTMQDFLGEMVEQIEILLPDYECYADKIGQYGYEDCIYISTILNSQKRIGINRYKRNYTFNITYFAENDDALKLSEFAVKLMENCTIWKIRREKYHTLNFTARQVDGAMHCVFDIVFHTVEQEEVELMGELKQERRFRYE